MDFVKKYSPASRSRAVYQRNFEVDLDTTARHNLAFFVSQELHYYNSLVEALTPRIRAFPEDFLTFKEKERKLWDACAENTIDPHQLLKHQLEQWPEHLKYMHGLLYDGDGSVKIKDNHLAIIACASLPARIHKMVRRLMAAEVLKYMLGQAETLNAGKLTEGLRNPMQMLQSHTVDTKRHLQIPGQLVSITYDEETECSKISIPYLKNPVNIPDVNLSSMRPGMLIIRSPHPLSQIQKWNFDIKDSASGYFLALTDYRERRRR
jgi:hypothetical protein